MENDILNHTALKYFGIKYIFPYQRLAAASILEAAEAEGFKRTPSLNPVTGETEVYDTNPHRIVILPTGSGKSLCFMLPAPLIGGITLVIYPLLSLIADQARRLIQGGFNPAILRGGQPASERERIWDDLRTGRSRIILSNPETVLQKNILDKLKTLDIRHLVVDEMHIVSEWGDTFRPSYLEISRVYRETGIKVVTAFTATASKIILNRVKEILFPDSSPVIISSDPDRPNIRYRVIRSISKNHDLSVIAKTAEKPMIVFCRSRTGAEMTARFLRENLQDGRIRFYHAGLSREEKKETEEWFFNCTAGILTATTAYGMGVDKADIRTVVHLDPPPSVEAYLQESGRAGRDRKSADAVLILAESDFLLAERLKDHVLKERYLNFLTAVSDNSICRRKSLMDLLGAVNESCSGCDVCAGDLQNKVPGLSEITSFIRRNSRKAAVREALLTLAGKRYPEVFKNGYCLSKYYGTLKSWTMDEIKEGIEELVTSEVISLPRRGPYRNRLVIRSRHAPKSVLTRIFG